MHPGILTDTLRTFLTAFGAGWSNLEPTITWLIGALLGIEMVLLGLWWALGGGEQLAAVMKKLLYLGVWMWIVTSFPALADAFVQSLIKAGRIAGGGGGPSLFDPSQIIKYGFTATNALQFQIANVGWNISNAIVYGLTYCLTLLAYIIIAWQVFYAVLEFNLIVALVGLFLPFGFLEQTKFLAEKSIGAVISSGVKLMVLAFILAVAEPILSTLTLPSGFVSFEDCWTILLTAGAIAFLAWNAPGIASGLLAGSPSLTAASGAQQAATATLAAGLTVAGGIAATRAAAGKIGQLAGGGTGKLLGSETPRATSASLAANKGRNGGEGLVASSGSGKGPDGGSGSSPSSSEGKHPSSSSPSGKPESTPPDWAKNMLHASRHLPDESRPSGGSATPDIKT